MSDLSIAADGNKEKSMLFFETKNQKTFVCWVPRKVKQVHAR
jgi:hypothetical protein